MWQRFSEQARKAVFYAQEEAQRFGQGYVSTEHLLLGICRESGTSASDVLEKMGIEPEQVRNAVVKILPQADTRPSQDMTLTPRAKLVIDHAYDEARSLDNNYIGTEHLLLGLIRDEGPAGKVLKDLGVTIEDGRQTVLALQADRGFVQEDGPGVISPTVGRANAKPFSLFRQFPVDFLALGALGAPSKDVDQFLKALQTSRDVLAHYVETAVMMRAQHADPKEFPLPITELMKTAINEAKLAQQELAPTHVLVAIFQEGENEFAKFFLARNETLDTMRRALA